MIAPRRILILKPCCLGDLVQATAIVAAVHRHWPEAAITIGTSRWSRPAIAHHPALAGVLDTGDLGIRARQRPAELFRLWPVLRRRRFDLAVVPDRSPVLSLLTRLAAIPVRAGYDSAGRGRWYSIRVPPLVRAHELEQAARLLEALGIADLPLPRFFPGPAGVGAARDLLRELGMPVVLAVLAPGGGANPGTRMRSKRWSIEGFAAVASRLRQADATVVLAGGADDAAIADAVASRAPGAVNLAGRTSIDALGALLGDAAVFVGNDSGTTHLAAACGCPTVAIFGTTAPELYGPRGRWVRVLAPPSQLRTGGSGSVRDPYVFAQPWQDAVPVGMVGEAALEGLAVGQNRGG